MRVAVRHPNFSVIVVNQTRQRFSLAFFRACGHEGLRILRGASGSDISVVFVGDTLMRKLNNRYRKKARSTNVLAFSYAKAFSGGKERIFGDIILCVPQARREAKLFGRTLKTHLAVLLVHGMVHLAGYSHTTEAQARKMERVEQRIIRIIGLS